ncbi:helix-turn-helix domain-containing protein [Amycolatopsis sp. M39]|uniref:helix-turn-helix domain-containing protein n=1 Tax=Amycolatopsis sp. M39 TaxID=1825094 RepID=UPI001E4E4B86|nr:helix-turn-helix transcriptional regulator [Amycolatopsis sp. M39]
MREVRGCAVPDWWPPALWDAARRGEHATVLRLAREERGWSQGQLGERFGCSASTISRFENSRRGLRDVAVLRRFASILDLPAEAFGLTGADRGRPASPASTALASKVSIDLSQEGDDPVRRRAFLLAAGLAGTAVASPNALAADGMGVDPAAFLAQRLDGILLGTTAGSARSTPRADQHAPDGADHRADRLPRLPLCRPGRAAAGTDHHRRNHAPADR